MTLQAKSFKGTSQHPNKFVQVPLQNAVHREIARYHLRLVGLLPACLQVVVHAAVSWLHGCLTVHAMLNPRSLDDFWDNCTHGRDCHPLAASNGQVSVALVCLTG